MIAFVCIHLCACVLVLVLVHMRGRSGSAMVLGKLPGPGHPTVGMVVGQGPIALAVGMGGALFGHFYCPHLFSPFSRRRPDID